jgi:hypothetical protein
MMDAIGHTIGYALTVLAVAVVMLVIDVKLALLVLLPLPLVSLAAWLYSRRYNARSRGFRRREATLESLHRRIVMLPQEGHLFSGTIADNVRLADPEASDEQVAGALESIGTRERFESLPDGLQTDVQSRGLRLSAGERQLVGIARVALAEPAVIVLGGHVESRPRHRGGGRACARRGRCGPHGRHDRAPALDRRAGRPCRRHGARPSRRGRVTRGARREGRALCAPVGVVASGACGRRRLRPRDCPGIGTVPVAVVGTDPFGVSPYGRWA